VAVQKRIFTFVIGGWSPSLVLEEKVETDCLVEEEELCCTDTLLLLATSPSDKYKTDIS
jgi:hypothetical protein